MSIFENLKAVGGVLQEAGKIEQYQQIIEAQGVILEMQKRLFDLEVENKELESKISQKDALSTESNAYWIRMNGENDGPFCTHCYDVREKLVRMRRGNYASGDWAFCPSCKETICR
mgnify:CR=1 FL=1